MYQKSNGLKRNISRCTLIYIILLFSLSVLFLLQSPLNPFSKNHLTPCTDSSVFLYIGNALKHGSVMYKDVFDHKGPFLYVIELLGLSLNGVNGVWLLEILNMFVATLFCFLLIKRFVSELIAFFSTVIVFVCMITFFEGGNLTEEYALSFIFISFYIFSGYFLNHSERINNISIAMTGICFCCVLLLRPNLVALWIVFCPIIFFYSIAKKNFKSVIRFTMFFLTGTLVVLIPFLIYFGATHSFSDFIYSYFIFNKEYSESDISRKALVNCAFWLFSALLSGYILQMVVGFFVYKFATFKQITKEMKLFYIAILLFTLISVMLSIMSKNQFFHYLMALIPCVALPVGLVLDGLSRFISRPALLKSSAIPSIIIFSFLIFSMFSVVTHYKDTVFANRAPNAQYAKISSLIDENTVPSDKIAVYGDYCQVYLDSHRESATKYIFTLENRIDNNLKQDYISDLKEQPPRAFVIQTDDLNGGGLDIAYVKDMLNSQYRLLENVGGMQVYLRNE